MFALRDLQAGDAGWVLEQHALHYSSAEGFDDSFEALVARVLADFLAHRDPATDRGWIAQQDGTRIGCVFCNRLDETAAQLRLLLVLPEWRGKGAGGMLLGALEDHARRQGFTRVKLWTHAEHADACQLYTRSGYICLSGKAVHSFGRDLTELAWEKPL